jgi:hypothetical protein
MAGELAREQEHAVAAQGQAQEQEQVVREQRVVARQVERRVEQHQAEVALVVGDRVGRRRAEVVVVDALEPLGPAHRVVHARAEHVDVDHRVVVPLGVDDVRA